MNGSKLQLSSVELMMVCVIGLKLPRGLIITIIISQLHKGDPTRPRDGNITFTNKRYQSFVVSI